MHERIWSTTDVCLIRTFPIADGLAIVVQIDAATCARLVLYDTVAHEEIFKTSWFHKKDLFHRLQAQGPPAAQGEGKSFASG